MPASQELLDVSFGMRHDCVLAAERIAAMEEEKNKLEALHTANKGHLLQQYHDSVEQKWAVQQAEKQQAQGLADLQGQLSNLQDKLIPEEEALAAAWGKQVELLNVVKDKLEELKKSKRKRHHQVMADKSSERWQPSAGSDEEGDEEEDAAPRKRAYMGYSQRCAPVAIESDAEEEAEEQEADENQLDEE